MTNTRQNRILFIGRLLFFIYLLILIYFLFFSDRYGRTTVSLEYKYNLIPLNEIKRYLLYSDKFTTEQLLVNVFGNVLAFLPYGFFIPITLDGYKSFFKVSLLSMFFSTCVELIQLLTRVGSFDIDDIILNTLGSMIGYILYLLFLRPFYNKKGGSRRK